MLSHSDKNYVLTKAVKQGIESIPPFMIELQNWFKQSYQVKPLNIILEDLSNNPKKRLNLIWEISDHSKIFNPKWEEFPQKEKLVVQQLIDIMGNQEYSSDKIFMINSNFSYAAMQEANSKITNEEIHSLKGLISNEEIWKIVKWNNSAIFFFENEQLKEKWCQPNQIRTLNSEYSKLLKKYDDFGYMQFIPVNVRIDSRQTIENTYGGNWNGYYRDN